MSVKEMGILFAGFLVVAFIVAAVGHAVSPDYTKRNYEFFNEMMHSPAYKTQSANPNFADGLTQRTPPAGTIARGERVLEFDPGPAGQDEAATLVNPVRDTDAAALARGEALFVANCVPCHGAGGEGDGPVAKKGYPPPPSLLAANARALEDGRIFHIITYGRANMPSIAVQLEEEDRWKVIRHIRSLQAKGATQ